MSLHLHTQPTQPPAITRPMYPPISPALRGVLAEQPGQSRDSPSCSTFAEPTPSKSANVCVRRAHHSSTLLQSPARPGHSAGLRNIFHTASQHSTPLSPYPQLPNVSRKASQPRGATSHELAAYVPPLHQPAPLLPVTHSQPANLTTAPVYSQHHHSISSESWSGDTGYLVAGSRGHTSELVIPLADRIAHWLSEVGDPETLDPLSMHEYQTDMYVDGNDGDIAQAAWSNETFQPCERNVWKPRPLVSPRRLWENGHDNIDDIFSTPLSRKFGSRNAQDFDAWQDDVELSPLSPNVCVERGPSRHRSRRELESTIRQMEKLKENTRQESDACINDSPTKSFLQTRRRRLWLAGNIVGDAAANVAGNSADRDA